MLTADRVPPNAPTVCAMCAGRNVNAAWPLKLMHPDQAEILVTPGSEGIEEVTEKLLQDDRWIVGSSRGWPLSWWAITAWRGTPLCAEDLLHALGGAGHPSNAGAPR